jgi:hypothetical protein
MITARPFCGRRGAKAEAGADGDVEGDLDEADDADRDVRSILEADHKVIDIAHQPGFAPQPALHYPFEYSAGLYSQAWQDGKAAAWRANCRRCERAEVITTVALATACGPAWQTFWVGVTFSGT